MLTARVEPFTFFSSFLHSCGMCFYIEVLYDYITMVIVGMFTRESTLSITLTLLGIMKMPEQAYVDRPLLTIVNNNNKYLYSAFL